MDLALGYRVQATNEVGAEVTRTHAAYFAHWHVEAASWRPLKRCHMHFGKAPVSLSNSRIDSSQLQCHFQASRLQDSDSMIFRMVVVGLVAQQSLPTRSQHCSQKALLRMLASFLIAAGLNFCLSRSVYIVDSLCCVRSLHSSLMSFTRPLTIMVSALPAY